MHIDVQRSTGSVDREQRLEDELERYAVLSSPAGRDLQALVDLVAQICEVPKAAINILSTSQQHMIATTAAMDPSVCARQDSMCAAVLSDPGPVVVPDASVDPRFATNPFVIGVIGHIRFYASAPLITPEGVTIGRLCVFDDAPRELKPEQERALMTLSGQVMDVLELRFRSRALEESMQELTLLRDELRRSNHHLALFAGQVSHDLRSPLTAILANAEMLATEPAVEVDTELLSMVEAVNQAGQRMNRMIEEMLGYALEGGQLRLDDTDLSHVLSLVLADLTPLIRQSGAAVTVDDLPTVMADADMLYSIVLNLLTNALKFTRAGVSPTVRVSAERRDGAWRVMIDDDGLGIPPERHGDVFTLFSRTTPEVPGHGIGLATTRRLVEAHGGRVGADASPLGGARVWFELPA
ncbi:MAG: hypothetical protein JWP31_2454 [Aeromicrobium sp.]|nr:hypothetical protein [Aeromicrobium sp.]